VSEVTFTLDGTAVTVPRGTTLLEAARGRGVAIPTLCHHPRLTPPGKCRLCVVEVEGWRALPPACVLPAQEGMQVQSASERVRRTRRVLLELHWSEYPEGVRSGDPLGRCELTDLVTAHGITRAWSPSGRRSSRVDDRHPLIRLDLGKCIGCGRCEQACREIAVCDVLAMVGRGATAHAATAFDLEMREAGCVACGACVSVCPTGALFDARSPRVPQAEVRATRTICPYCGVGCAMDVSTHRGRIVLVTGSNVGPANRGALCVKGRYGFEYASHPDRLTVPLIRREGAPRVPPEGVEPRRLFREATWEEALGLVASSLRALLAAHGPPALGILGSAKCPNEDNYVLQRFARAALGTNNIDHCARLCHSSSVSAMTMAFGHGAMTNAPQEIPLADVLFLLGHNTTETHPVIGGAVKRAVRAGTARLIVLDPRRTELALLADVHLRPRGGTDAAVLNGLAYLLVEEGCLNEAFIRERTEGFEGFRASLSAFTPERVEALSGVPAEDLRRAARLYGRARSGMMFHGMGMTQHTTGTDNVLAICNLALLTGSVGRPGTGVNPVRGQNNVQGASDMGVLPDFFPGYRPVSDAATWSELEERWGRPLPRDPGLTVVEMVNAAQAGRLKGMVLMGENPMVSDPDLNHVRAALSRLGFLVSQEIFLTETAALADVVLPATSHFEKDGTTANTERRVQWQVPVLAPPGQARRDWAILADLSARLGYPMAFAETAAITRIIAEETPIYRGIVPERLGPEGLQWPCWSLDHPGTSDLHQTRFTRGRGKFHPVPFRPAAELPDAAYPLLLNTGRVLEQWHTRSMTGRVPGLNALAPEALLEMHPEDASRLGVRQGGRVRVSSRRGTLLARTTVTERTPPRSVFLPFHYAEAAANLLTNAALDPHSRIPEYKVCAVRVEPTGD
jgi:formate dehydrogenase alpha subunit